MRAVLGTGKVFFLSFKLENCINTLRCQHLPIAAGRVADRKSAHDPLLIIPNRRIDPVRTPS